jgi:hypothetical protein
MPPRRTERACFHRTLPGETDRRNLYAKFCGDVAMRWGNLLDCHWFDWKQLVRYGVLVWPGHKEYRISSRLFYLCVEFAYELKNRVHLCQ